MLGICRTWILVICLGYCSYQVLKVKILIEKQLPYTGRLYKAALKRIQLGIQCFGLSFVGAQEVIQSSG